MKKITLLSVALFLIFQANAFALLTSDAPSYATATHTTSEWQRLGATNQSDDGVTWSVNGGDFGYNTLNVGDNVTFQVNFWHAGYGNHNYDQMKLWADFNHNNQFEENDTEVLTYIQQWKTGPDGNNSKRDDVGVSSWKLSRWNHKYGGYNEYFISFVVTQDMAGDDDGFWLRARVNCWDVAYPGLTATGSLYQGEVEDYFVQINPGTPGSPVPLPASLMLFGLGLFSIAGLQRKKTK